MKHLVALVSDKNMEFAFKGLLTRHVSLGTWPIVADVFVHPQHDPGCLLNPEAVLAPLQHGYERALVMFDRHGCGQEHRGAIELAQRVEARLAQCGWADRVGAVVIDPELENWVWAQSSHVDRVLGWAGRVPNLRTWLNTTLSDSMSRTA
jgi:hypothetical protein